MNYENKTVYLPKSQATIKMKIAYQGIQAPYFAMTYAIGQREFGNSVERFKDELEPLGLYKYAKWHLVSMKEPLHYIANSLYFLDLVDKKRKQYWAKNYNVERFKSTCLYGILEDDMSFKPEMYIPMWPDPSDEFAYQVATLDAVEFKRIVTEWLENRLPRLMSMFYDDMLVLFEGNDKVKETVNIWRLGGEKP